MFRLTALFVFAFTGLSQAAPVKNPRIIGLLNVVTFQNDPCTSVSSTPAISRKGTCYSTEDCANKGGQVDGFCAAGFGVCCIFRLMECGGSVSQNCTYIQNPGTPSSFTLGTTTSCQYTFPRISEEICRIRLDFNTLQIRQAPTTTGVCGTENVAVTSTSRSLIPAFCGTLTDQHMYITTPDTGNLGMLTLNFDTTDTTTRRSWDIKVTQVPCSETLSLPPDGCLQYFTGVSGTVKSYNFGVLLASTAYDNCIRNEIGFCSIQYTESASDTPDPFKVGNDAAGRTDGANCADGRVIISGAESSVVCGNFLTQVDSSMSSSQVIANSIPFILRLETTNTLNDQTGFNLVYTQIPC
eukprot:TRINITY_DN1591_c0_g1_i1.p1 TRINITY_DN1591_c0_g1~~TRINITY_DN1591_c0_g1_i1.p1  ORF type:complete len:354 (-),score=-14.50 TRINITY_DN1591_c0_g1_i1:207-1268(-)